MFDEVKSIVTSCVDGYNVCTLAYGQTGSGKTYTMMGTRDDPGVNIRCASKYFFNGKKTYFHELNNDVTAKYICLLQSCNGIVTNMPRKR